MPVAPGWSLRWQVALTPDEVSCSRRVLDRLGLNADVGSVVAPTLHPGESWALWCYARGASLGPGWIASQCYDFRAACARPAGLSSRYDLAGRLLAALAPETAEMVLDVVDHYCPHRPEAMWCDERLRDAEPAVAAACEEVWAMFSSQRLSRSRLDIIRHEPAERVLVSGAPSQGRSGPEHAFWKAACERLAQELVPVDFATWLAPLQVLDIIDDTVILGAPNVFVRDQVITAYHATLTELIASELRRDVRVEIIIHCAGFA